MSKTAHNLLIAAGIVVTGLVWYFSRIVLDFPVTPVLALVIRVVLPAGFLAGIFNIIPYLGPVMGTLFTPFNLVPSLTRNI